MRPTFFVLGGISLGLLGPHSAMAQLAPERFVARTAQFFRSRGYADEARPSTDFYRIVTTRIPADIQGIGTSSPRGYVAIERSCPDSLKPRVPHCVRIDMMEIYAAGADSVLQGLIPLTYIGTKGGGLFEVSASRDAQADAELGSRAMHRAVYSGYQLSGPGLPAPDTAQGDSHH